VIIQKIPRLYIVLTIILLFLVSAAIPFRLVLAPERQIQVVDNNAKPIAHAVIRRAWYQYALEIGGEEEFVSNSNGAVNLPVHKVGVNIIEFVLGILKQIREVGIHASYSTSESVAIFADNYEDKWLYDEEIVSAETVILNEKPE